MSTSLKDTAEDLLSEVARRAARRAQLLAIINEHFEFDGARPGDWGALKVQRGYFHRFIADKLGESPNRALIYELAEIMSQLGVYPVTSTNKDYYRGIGPRHPLPDYWAASRERMLKMWQEKKKSATDAQ